MNEYLRNLELSVEEKNKMHTLDRKIRELNEELYKAVDLQVSERGKDTTLINILTSSIIDLKNQYTGYYERMGKKKNEESRLNRLVKSVKT